MADKKDPDRGKGAQSGIEKSVRKTQTGKGSKGAKNPSPNPRKGGRRGQ